MCDPGQPPPPARLPELLVDGDDGAVIACLERLGSADADRRKRTLRAVRNVAEDRPAVFEGRVGALEAFLSDDDRAVRLTTAKVFVTLARSQPEHVRPVVDALADRLADDEAFYYVRARCAEALGYVAAEAPEAVADPETLAELRVGLAFDEPEVREKLAKALSHVALGDPSRLRHHVGSLAEHLDDENPYVRYHLCTALVVVGCEQPAELADAAAALRERLDDENPYVRGRAAEALGLLAESTDAVETNSGPDDVTAEDPPAFLTDRVRFYRRRVGAGQSGSAPSDVGTVASVRAGTDDVVAELTAPDGEECPNCGLNVQHGGPPMCPRCGVPR
ncbi:HEAT repeat domain-containing protein [Halovivax limisalsi]|uniref:HEAT repeat domain-containing protein n=1 Tax=Halovivax limisalsi TaxID=1453760 RepID=UPI001FFC3596|nr:HEAT repeat domain-containing protein [Halovivax limisalsi]